VQWPAVRSLSGMMRLEYLNFKSLQKLTRVKAGVSEEVEKRLKRGLRVAELLKQPNYAPVPMEDQVACLFAFKEGVFDDCLPEEVQARIKQLLTAIRTNQPDLLPELAKIKELTEDIKGRLKNEFARLRNSAV